MTDLDEYARPAGQGRQLFQLVGLINGAVSHMVDAELSREHPVILIGGYRRLPVNAGDVICRNRECRFFNRQVWVDVLANIPPVPVNGVKDFWHEYEGGDVDFYFCICRNCRTIISIQRRQLTRPAGVT